MSNTGNQVVFLIHPNFSKLNDKKEWNNILFKSTVRILSYFSGIASRSSNWNSQDGLVPKSEHKLKWGYKFASKSGIKFHAVNEFKPVNVANLEFFREELKYNGDDDEAVDYSSHALADNLSAMAHDFKWEQHEIESPIKPIRKRPSSGHSRKRRFNGNLLDSNLSNDEKMGKNYVFVIGPVPRSREELNNYFEWQVQDVNEIGQTLMPKHLAHHFRDKHDMRFFWLDTRKVPFENFVGVHNDGLLLMDKFLNNHKGCVLPISLLGDDITENSLPAKDAAVQNICDVNQNKLRSSRLSSLCNASVLHDSIGSDTVFDDTDTVTISSDSRNKMATFPISSVLSHFCTKFASSIEKRTLPGTLIYCGQSESDSTETRMPLNFQYVTNSSYNHCQLFCDVQHQLFENSAVNPNTNEICINFNPCSDENNLSKSASLRLTMNGDQSTSPKDLITLPKTVADSETFTIIGKVPISAVSRLDLSGSSFICAPKDDSAEFSGVIAKLFNESNAVVVKSGCWFCENSKPLFKNCSIFHHFGILVPLSASCASISWLSEMHRQSVIKLLGRSFIIGSPSYMEIVGFVQEAISSYKPNDKQTSQTKLEMQSNDVEPFNACMLETWYETATTSRKYNELCQNVQRHTVTAKSKQESSDVEFSNSILSELQCLYNTESCTSKKIKEATTSCLPEFKKSDLNSTSGFSCWEDVTDFMLTEYTKFLETYTVQQTALMKQKAHNMVSAICSYAEKQGSAVIAEVVQDVLTEFVFVTPSSIRSKDASQDNKSAEYMFQTLLRMEWISYKLPLCDDNDEYVEVEVEIITQLLRAISISQSLEKMIVFLQEVLVEFFASSCGKLLHEVHSDLMLPIPDVLREFSSETGINDSFFGLSSVTSEQPPSMGPFSALSSVGSQGSTDSRTSKKNQRLRKSSYMKPLVVRQIAVPSDQVKSKESKRSRSKTVETAKSHLFATSKNTMSKVNENPRNKLSSNSNDKKPTNESENAFSQEVGRVRRDLFASPSKSARKRSRSVVEKQSNKVTKPLKKELPQKPRRRHSVIDTPAAKQKLTALARQRIRMRRSQESQENNERPSETIVEESPMKLEEQTNESMPTKDETKLRRSPRHSIMLTRRHSFYRNSASGKCRTVARAQVVQQHHEAAPPTPRITPSSLVSAREGSAAAANFSPKSLLFSYSGSGLKSNKIADADAAANMQRSRRRLKLVSSALPTATPATTDSVETEVESAFSKTTPTTSHEIDSSNVHPQMPNDVGEVTNSNCSVSPKPTESMPNVLQQKSQNPGSPSKPQIKYKPDIPSCQSEIPSSLQDENSAINSADSHTICKEPTSCCSPQNHRAPQSIDRLHSKLLSPPQLTPACKHAMRRSPRLANRDSDRTPLKAPPLKKHGPLDNYVIRTPTPCKQPKQTRTTPVVSKRKPSPIGDHIRKWPRKKRLADNSSPNFIAKRRKRGSLSKTIEEDLAMTADDIALPVNDGLSDTAKANSMESPDTGVYIVSGGNSQQRLCKIIPTETDDTSPGIEVEELLKKVNAGQRATDRRGSYESPRKQLSGDLLDDMGVYPIIEKSGSSPFRRWTSPRRRIGGTLYHARLGSPSSNRRVPMMLLHEDSD